MSEIKRMNVLGPMEYSDEGMFVHYLDHESALAAARQEVDLLKQMLDNAEKHGQDLKGKSGGHV